MKRLATAALVAALAAIATAALATAAAPTKGRLVVVNPANRVGALGGTTILAIQAPNTYRTTVYVPQGYRPVGGIGSIKPGKQFGTATVYVAQQDGSRATLNGTLTAQDPTKVADTNCAGGGKHAAVWTIDAKQTAGTMTATIPVYVDATAAGTPEAEAGQYKLSFCASAASGLKVSEVDLGLGRLFVNPVAKGVYLWRAVFDPFASDGKSIASGSSREVVSSVPLNIQVTTKVARIKSNARWVAFTGFVTVADQPLSGVRVQLFVGKQKQLNLARPAATVRTKANGSYRVVLRLKKGSWWVRAKATSPYQDITPGGGCATVKPTISAGGCVDATLTSFIVLNPTVRRVF